MILFKSTLFVILVLFSYSSYACTSLKTINVQIKYISPCVTDICIQTFVNSFNKFCLATIEFNNEKDWAYIYGKKCNQLQSNKFYTVEVSQRRPLKSIFPLIVFTPNFKPSTSSINKARKELEEYKQKRI